MRWWIAISLVGAALPLGAAEPDGPEQIAARLETRAAAVPAPLGLEFRVLAAQDLRARHPQMAQELASAVAAQLRQVPGARLRPATFEMLAAMEPDLPKPTVKPQTPTSPAPPATTEATPQPRPEHSAAFAEIERKIHQFRGLPTDADRAQLAIQLAPAIRALPGPEELALATALCGVITEGDLGAKALAAAAGALADSIQGMPKWANAAQPDSGVVLELAGLVRYEHVPAPVENPALGTALLLLELRERLHQEAGFSLAGLDANAYSLPALRGKVVLLNFWATWCPPCRKEMPDMEKLYREFASRGFVVLAVSDENPDVVREFLADKHYTFPILLDTDRKVHEAFNVEGIPQSFLFDRDGKIVAQSIDMRTERQFRRMLSSAGLE
ncbi:MAG TPA: redoxin domain-containing protein [Bryobacteraceae bacterium]|nr:redoxin domain-containing protein [Bryobacteraceae bacterium]